MNTVKAPTRKRLNADIDENLHHQFKLACLSRKANMTDVLENFIIKYVDLSNQKAKPKTKVK